MWRATSTRRYFKGFGVREMTQGTMTAPELAPGADSAVTAAAPLAAYGAVRVPHRAGATAGATTAAGVSSATTSAVTYVSDTVATCGVPAGAPATLHDFALGNPVGLTAWRWAVDEVALSCGSTAAPHAGVAAGAYTRPLFSST